MATTAARTAAFPEALDPVADRVEARIDALLTNDRGLDLLPELLVTLARLNSCEFVKLPAP